jgi:hypothetical protein
LPPLETNGTVEEKPSILSSVSLTEVSERSKAISGNHLLFLYTNRWAGKLEFYPSVCLSDLAGQNISLT